MPYLGTINGGYYFNVLYLTFNSHKTLIDKTIEGPIPVCKNVFENIGRCTYLSKTELATAGPLVPFRFHNKVVQAHPKVKAIYDQEWYPLMVKNGFLEVLVQNEVVLVPDKTKEVELANLITNLIHSLAPEHDFVLINSGGLRTTWFPGIIEFQHFYNMFPFTNSLKSFEITGKELLQTLAIVQSGAKGYYPTYGFTQYVQTSSGEKHKFINATMYNGTAIDPEATYKGITIDFLLNGGDDFKDVIGKVYTPRNVRDLGVIRTVLKKPLVDLKVIEEGTLIDPDHPRLIVLN